MTSTLAGYCLTLMTFLKSVDQRNLYKVNSLYTRIVSDLIDQEASKKDKCWHQRILVKMKHLQLDDFVSGNKTAELIQNHVAQGVET